MKVKLENNTAEKGTSKASLQKKNIYVLIFTLYAYKIFANKAIWYLYWLQIYLIGQHFLSIK